MMSAKDEAYAALEREIHDFVDDLAEDPFDEEVVKQSLSQRADLVLHKSEDELIERIQVLMERLDEVREKGGNDRD